MYFNYFLWVKLFPILYFEVPLYVKSLLVLNAKCLIFFISQKCFSVPPTCPRLLINREKVGLSDSMMAALENLFGGTGLNLDSPKNSRDVALLGDCDDGCKELSEKLGWKVRLTC